MVFIDSGRSPGKVKSRCQPSKYDAGKKFLVNEIARFKRLGVEIDEHGKMPDVIIHDTGRAWLVLVEAVTAHGPINPKRRDELKRLFAGSRLA